MLRNLILQFSQFPGAETIHLLQGVVCGILLVSGYLRSSVARVVIALVLMAGFAIYEGYEQWRIGDAGDIDFQVFLITMWLTMHVTLAVHLARRHWGRKPADDEEEDTPPW